MKYGTLAVIIILVALIGCRSYREKSISDKPATVQVDEGEAEGSLKPLKLSDSEDSKYIDVRNIEWMKMLGGLHLNTKALFAGNDDDKIAAIAGLINSASNVREASKKEISPIYSMIRPIGISIKMKDGDRVYVWPTYDIASSEDGFSAEMRKDRVVLQYNSSGKDSYYAADSGELIAFLSREWINVMPEVEEFKVYSGDLFSEGENPVIRRGDSITVCGDGCTETQVTLYICKEGNNEEKYAFARVEPCFGKWQWEGVVSSTIRTVEGREVTLGDGRYSIEAQIGQTSISSGIIEIKRDY